MREERAPHAGDADLMEALARGLGVRAFAQQRDRLQPVEMEKRSLPPPRDAACEFAFPLDSRG